MSDENTLMSEEIKTLPDNMSKENSLCIQHYVIPLSDKKNCVRQILHFTRQNVQSVKVLFIAWDQGPNLVTWFNLNPSMDKK